MTKYKKKPVVVEAYQYLKGINDLNIISFIKFGDYLSVSKLPKNYFNAKLNKANLEPIQIHTLEGKMLMPVFDKDYVVKDANGEFYPCKPDIFEKTYELADYEY